MHTPQTTTLEENYNSTEKLRLKNLNLSNFAELSSCLTCMHAHEEKGKL